MGVVGKVQSYPLGRWTHNYLPVDPLPAETGAPLDWPAAGIPEEKSFCIRVVCQNGGVALTRLSLSRGLCPSPPIPQLVEGAGTGPDNTDLRQTSCPFFELHRLLMVGVEILDGVGEGHSKI